VSLILSRVRLRLMRSAYDDASKLRIYIFTHLAYCMAVKHRPCKNRSRKNPLFSSHYRRSLMVHTSEVCHNPPSLSTAVINQVLRHNCFSKIIWRFGDLSRWRERRAERRRLHVHHPVHFLSFTHVIFLEEHGTLWRPLLPYGYSYKASCARPD